MSNFDHDYYSLNDELKETVLCMRCAFPVKKPEYTKDQVREYYKEVKVFWSYGNGITANGVLITCPNCINSDLSDDDKKKIKRQVIQALELQMKKDKKDQQEIDSIKNLFNKMDLMGRI